MFQKSKHLSMTNKYYKKLPRCIFARQKYSGSWSVFWSRQNIFFLPASSPRQDKGKKKIFCRGQNIDHAWLYFDQAKIQSGSLFCNFRRGKGVVFFSRRNSFLLAFVLSGCEVSIFSHRIIVMYFESFLKFKTPTWFRLRELSRRRQYSRSKYFCSLATWKVAR